MTGSGDGWRFTRPGGHHLSVPNLEAWFVTFDDGCTIRVADWRTFDSFFGQYHPAWSCPMHDGEFGVS